MPIILGGRAYLARWRGWPSHLFERFTKVLKTTITVTAGSMMTN